VAAAARASKTLNDIEDVRAKLQELATEGRVDELIEIVLDLLVRVRNDNSKLAIQLKEALRRLYGRRSEKVSSSQLSLMFSEIGLDVPASAEDALASSSKDEETVPVPPNKPRGLKGKPGRKPLPPDLPRETDEQKVPEDQRTCAECGSEKKTIGYLCSEILEFVPGHFKVIEEKREKIACAACEAGVQIADSQKVMCRGRPGPGLLAHIVVSKHADALPIYRQSQIYDRYGVHIPDATLGEWGAFAIDVMRPVARLIARLALESWYINLDDTTLRVQDRKSPKGIRKGRLWCLVGEKPYVAFFYAPDWRAEHAAEFLQGFDGFIQGDGYAGYARALGPPGQEAQLVPDERRLGCGMHIRRKFEQAAESGDARGAIALAYFRKIYAIERKCKDDKVFGDERKAFRDEHSVPIVAELYAWVDQIHQNVVPGTKLHQATTYARNQRQYFERCFTDGRFEIDNGEAERQIRPLKLGEKNYLFAGSPNGAADIAIARTIINTCHRAGVDPLAYLTDAIVKIQRGWPTSRLAELLPDRWNALRESAAAAT
jgi:transposase